MSFGSWTILKHLKRSNTYRNSTDSCGFNPETKQGYSYDWTFVGMINGQVLFNTYNWSSTTSAHQKAMRRLLNDLKIGYISGDFGRRDISSIPHSMDRIYSDLVDLQIEMESTRPGTRKRSWLEGNLTDQTATFNTLLSLGCKLSLKEQARIRKHLYESANEEVNNNEYLKACKLLDQKNALTNLADPIF